MRSKYVKRQAKKFVPVKDSLDQYKVGGNKDGDQMARIFPHESREALVRFATDRLYKGDWLPDTSYKEGDQVTYAASLYQATKRNRNVRPNTQDSWHLMAGSGAGGGGGLTEIKPHNDVDLSAIVLSASSNIVWDMSLSWIAHLQLDGASNQMGTPDNLLAHSSGKLYLDPNGQSSFSWNSAWDWNGSPPAMPSLGKALIVGWDCPDGTKCVCGVFAEYTI